MRKIMALLAVATPLGLGVMAAQPAGASVPAENAHDCQGSDVSNFASGHIPFGRIVSGFAQDGSLVGVVRGAANCGNN